MRCAARCASLQRDPDTASSPIFWTWPARKPRPVPPVRTRPPIRPAEAPADRRPVTPGGLRSRRLRGWPAPARRSCSVRPRSDRQWQPAICGGPSGRSRGAAKCCRPRHMENGDMKMPKVPGCGPFGIPASAGVRGAFPPADHIRAATQRAMSIITWSSAVSKASMALPGAAAVAGERPSNSCCATTRPVVSSSTRTIRAM